MDGMHRLMPDIRARADNLRRLHDDATQAVQRLPIRKVSHAIKARRFTPAGFLLVGWRSAALIGHLC
jgi:hypothetical protein